MLRQKFGGGGGGQIRYIMGSQERMIILSWGSVQVVYGLFYD